MWKTYKSVKRIRSIGDKLKGEFDSLMKEFGEDLKDFDEDFKDSMEEAFESPSQSTTSATHEIHASGFDVFSEKVNATAATGWILKSISFKDNLYTALFYKNPVKK